MFSESLVSHNLNTVQSIQNIKVIDHMNSLSPMLKEGEELYIKESNGNIKRVNEVIRLQDGTMIPKAILDGIHKIDTIKFGGQNQNDLSNNHGVDDLSQNIINWINLPQGSSNCKIQNFKHLAVQNISQGKINFVENIDEVVSIHKNIINRIENIHFEKNSTDSSQQKIVLDFKKSEPSKKSNDHVCEDYEIEKLITESIRNEQSGNITDNAVCNVVLTDQIAHNEASMFHSKSKYMLIYLFIVLPLFVISILQHQKSEELDSYSVSQNDMFKVVQVFSKQGDIKHKKPNKYKYNAGGSSEHSSNFYQIFASCRDNLTKSEMDVLNGSSDLENNSKSDGVLWSIVNIFKYICGLIYYIIFSDKPEGLSSDNPTLATESANNSASNILSKAACKNRNDCNDFYCPNHYPMCSTEEASSSEADFAMAASSKPKMVKHKKNRKEVKKSK